MEAACAVVAERTSPQPSARARRPVGEIVAAAAAEGRIAVSSVPYWTERMTSAPAETERLLTASVENGGLVAVGRVPAPNRRRPLRTKRTEPTWHTTIAALLMRSAGSESTSSAIAGRGRLDSSGGAASVSRGFWTRSTTPAGASGRPRRLRRPFRVAPGPTPPPAGKARQYPGVAAAPTV
jgi:hypothetical protein